MLRLGVMAHTVCCTAVNPTKEVHTLLNRVGLYCVAALYLCLSVCVGTDKGTRINALTNIARAEQLHLLCIRQERIKLQMPPHDKVRDEMQ
ncbi:hypothetical protein AVEN_196448-1 [Araneus ventricosus]|uniref:Uncharacterized protein n=1 Tax=Araneus ventricosus TaxID=182803 RepID=A0A4Y2AX24_ARAVE|nr:hypothetical protein AVEN_196448-1 [Araneus ventricosus]